VVQIEPWLARDKLMIDTLKSIGIEKGKPFNPDANTQDILKSAALAAHALLESRYEGVKETQSEMRWCLSRWSATATILEPRSGRRQLGPGIYNPSAVLQKILIQMMTCRSLTRSKLLMAEFG
jgi:hypothetical protein